MTKNLKHTKLRWLRTVGAVPLVTAMMMLFGFTHRAPEVVTQMSEATDVIYWLDNEKREMTKEEFGALAPEDIQYINVLKNDRDSIEWYLEETGRESADGVIVIGLKSKETPVYIDDEMPTFEGGDLMKFREWVQSRLIYPRKALRNKIEGKVVLKWVIEEDGTLTDIEVIDSPDRSLTKEAIRVVKQSPKWSPGKRLNKPVRVYYVMPVIFTLPVGDDKH